MLVADVLERHGLGVIALLPETQVAGAALLLSEQSIGAGVIIDSDGGMVGILSERDIARGLGEFGADVADMSVADLMTDRVISCSPETTVVDALGTMQSMNVRHLPVVDAENHLVGMVSLRDLINLGPTAFRVLH